MARPGNPRNLGLLVGIGLLAITTILLKISIKLISEKRKQIRVRNGIRILDIEGHVVSRIE